MGKLVVIDGIVGAGKTTLVNALAGLLGFIPCQELTSEDTYILLERFYANQSRWAFTLQIHFLARRFKLLTELQQQGKSAILDRSIYGDHIFAETLWEDNLMSIEEYNTYRSLYSSLVHQVKPVDLLVYLDCPLDLAISRIQQRNRGLEPGVPRSYWQRLHGKYQDWVAHYNDSALLVVDMASFTLSETNLPKLAREITTRL